jgi:hypothetical protein
VSYDLAVWEACLTSDRATPQEVLDDLWSRYEGTSPQAPSPPLASYLELLLGRFPDEGPAASVESVWAMSGVLGSASGPWVYLTLTYPAARRFLKLFVSEALSRGLACFDPQTGELHQP